MVTQAYRIDMFVAYRIDMFVAYRIDMFVDQTIFKNFFNDLSSHFFLLSGLLHLHFVSYKIEHSNCDEEDKITQTKI